METPDYYTILGVPPTASQEQIERAYKRPVTIRRLTALLLDVP